MYGVREAGEGEVGKGVGGWVRPLYAAIEGGKRDAHMCRRREAGDTWPAAETQATLLPLAL